MFAVDRDRLPFAATFTGSLAAGLALLLLEMPAAAGRGRMLNATQRMKGFPSTVAILCFSITICWIIWAMCFSALASIDIPTEHLDGAFQTASGLHRLDAGQFPGRNFYPYLGIGIIFTLYPFFKVFGAHLAASVFSAQFMVLLVGTLSTAFVWHMVWRPRSFTLSIVASCVLFLAPISLSTYFSLSLPNSFVTAYIPGNSLRPLRAAAPYLMGITYYFFILNTKPKIKYPLSGFLTGLFLLWSNDFALSTATLFTLFICTDALYNDELSFKNIFLYCFSTIISWAAIITLATYGHPAAMIKYNFFDVAYDQWWYFALYAEEKRIFNPMQLTKLLNVYTYRPLFVLALVAFVTWRTRTIEHALLMWTGVALFAGGVVPSVGGHITSYFGGFNFWAMMVVSIGFLRLIWSGFKNCLNVTAGFTYDSSRATPILTLILLVPSALLMFEAFDQLRGGQSAARIDPDRFFVPELGGYLGREWEDYIALARRSEAANVVEEYWGMWSATQRTFSNWPVDAVIHALGSVRDRAYRSLEQADIIITTKHSMSAEWQPWIVSQNYWLYEFLFRWWTPYASSPTTIMWKKSKSPRVFKDVNCNLNSVDQSVILQAEHAGFYQIDIQYSVSGSGRVLAMIRNNISFALDADGYVSVDPEGTRAKFPVYTKNPGSLRLDTKVIGNSDREFDIHSCAANSLPEMPVEVLQAPTGK